MQFTSYAFILLFLPLFVLGYFLLNKVSKFLGKLLIIAAGLVFYFCAGLESFSVSGADVSRNQVLSVSVFGGSILLNLLLSILLAKIKKGRKQLLAAAIVLNVLLLLLFKYRNFAITTVNGILGTGIRPQEILLPLAISFFTFQQIMYVVSVYRGEVESVNVTDYLAYILYFPKLLMGPLIEPSDLISQLNDSSLKKFRWENLAAGIKIFSLGLFKKVVLADTFAGAVSWAFVKRDSLTAGEVLLFMLCYTFEIYFDFSGYSDMAVGASKMVNITLPINFDSPYKAVSIRDFWKRWHMSLTAFLTKYVYIPLGGSRKGKVRTCLNIMIVFLVSGLWHGADWTYILWGALHGLLMVLDRIFSKPERRNRNICVKWFGTFLAVNMLWLLFRSMALIQYKEFLERIFCFADMGISEGFLQSFVKPETAFLFEALGLSGLNGAMHSLYAVILLAVSFIICLVPENNYRNLDRIGTGSMLLSAAAFSWAFLCLSSESVFVYFNF